MRTCLAAPIALLFAAPAFAQVPAWHVSEVSGDVRIVENGQAHAAARGALVPAGAIVVTAAGARAVIVRAHDYVVVSPASRIRVPTVPQQGGSGLIQMMTDAGTALFRIQHQATPHFGVRTPYLAAVVKGTVFTVTVGERAASVQVTEGAVQVSTVDGGAAEMIRPGMVATIAAADLQLLHVEGETSRDIRSNGIPSAGVVTVPASEAGRYEGPAETPVAVSAAVRADAVSLADATGGLLGGSIGGGTGGDRAFAEVQVAARIDNHGGRDGAGNGNGGGTGTTGNGNGNSGNGNGNGAAPDTAGNGNGNSGNGNGNGGGTDTTGTGNGNSGSGNGNGGGTDTTGNGNGNSGTGNGNGGGTDTTGNGNGNGNSGNGNGNGGGTDTTGNGNGNSGNGNADDGNNGHGNDADGLDESNPGNGNGNGNGRKPNP